MGAASCIACPDGSTSAQGAAECSPLCAAGTYLSGDSCVDCPAGTFQLQHEHEQTSCIDCPAGRYTPSTGGGGEADSYGCLYCPAGQMQAAEGQSECTECEVGQTQQLEGQTSCELCSPRQCGDGTGNTGPAVIIQSLFDYQLEG